MLAVAPLVTRAAWGQTADVKAQCAAAYEATQALKRDGKLVDARAKAVACAQETCPPVTTKDCAAWLAEIDAGLPSVVVRVHDGPSKDVADVVVKVDGKSIAERADGREIAVDPGERVFRFEPRGRDAVERTIVISAGEKRRAIEVDLAPPPEPSPPKAPPPPAPPPPAPSRFTAPVAIFGALGLAGFGAFGAFGAVALSERSKLRDTCSPRCADSDVANVRWKLVAADVGLGVGAASIVVAAVLLIRGPSEKPRPAAALSLEALPLPKGAGGSLRALF